MTTALDPKHSALAIDGYDPLDSLSSGQTEILKNVAHRNVVNILKSYTGFYDLFAEAIQNALDAIERKTTEQKEKRHEARIWITINLRDRIVRVAAEDIKTAIRDIGVNKCARESGFDRKNFVRKLVRGIPVKRNSYNEFLSWLSAHHSATQS